MRNPDFLYLGWPSCEEAAKTNTAGNRIKESQSAGPDEAPVEIESMPYADSWTPVRATRGGVEIDGCDLNCAVCPLVKGATTGDLSSSCTNTVKNPRIQSVSDLPRTNHRPYRPITVFYVT